MHAGNWCHFCAPQKTPYAEKFFHEIHQTPLTREIVDNCRKVYELKHKLIHSKTYKILN